MASIYTWRPDLKRKKIMKFFLLEESRLLVVKSRGKKRKRGGRKAGEGGNGINAMNQASGTEWEKETREKLPEKDLRGRRVQRPARAASETLGNTIRM